jgi:hypothetical protein
MGDRTSKFVVQRSRYEEIIDHHENQPNSKEYDPESCEKGIIFVASLPNTIGIPVSKYHVFEITNEKLFSVTKSFHRSLMDLKLF